MMIKKYILKENGVYVVTKDNSNCFYSIDTEEFEEVKKETSNFTLVIKEEVKKDIKNEQIKALEQSIAELSMQIAMQNLK